MTHKGIFPFGKPVQFIQQMDRTPKQVFILGVYASAVHARWIGQDEKQIVKALAVASEPYIFWKGENDEEVIQGIDIPKELGKLLLAGKHFNGPSGKALDRFILHPLGLNRSQTWLCDLVPYSCKNPSQHKAIERTYRPLIKDFELPEPTVQPVPKRLTDDSRRREIMNEIIESEANTLILLGDQPIKWFLSYFDHRKKQLSDFVEDQGYGELVSMQLNSNDIQVLPLAHPRQIARLGRSSISWYKIHQTWIKKSPNRLFL